jgi:hypothetical protein
MAVVMLATPVMSAGASNAPKGLRPSLDVKLAAEWRYADSRGVFVSSAGEEFSPAADLPKGTQIRYMAPQLARADRATLSADERNLASYLQIIFPKGAQLDRWLSDIARWPCVEQVQRPPEISLP